MPIKSYTRYPFTTWAAAGAPTDPGVYALWQDEELIYYGCACGEGVIDWDRIVATLAGAGHDVVLSVECASLDAATKSYSYLTELIDKHAR